MILQLILKCCFSNSVELDIDAPHSRAIASRSSSASLEERPPVSSPVNTDSESEDKVDIVYNPQEDELIEDEDLTIIGESVPDSDEDSSSDNDDDSPVASDGQPHVKIPVRYLSNFTIYDRRSRILQPLDVNSPSLRASGTVRAKISDEEEELDLHDLDEDEDNSTSDTDQFITLSKITAIWTDPDYKDW